ncbi:MAG: hypothetical protein K6E37_05495 [Bacteroidales bacterium]|nr:hypothetical protein [Bacteroidales bacterium]
MRRITIILMSIAALALASSCNKILNPESTPDGYITKTIHLSANEILTDKAAFGDMTSEGYPMIWQAGDEVVLSINGDPDLTQVLTVTPTDGGSTADFGDITVTLPAEGSVEIFVSTNTTTESAGRTGTIKHSPTAADSQKPEAASCDPSSILLYAKKSYSSAADVPVDNIKLDFNHSTAYGKMTISGITLNGGETVKFVEIQTPKDQNIGGTVTIADDGSLSGGSIPSIIMRNISDFSNPIWFAIAPTILNSSSALMVHVVTSEDRHFEKTLNCSAKALEFNAGRVSKFTVNFSGISAAPRQVKTVRDLVLLKNALNNSDYNYWLNSGNEILLANDLEYGGASVTGNATDVPAGITFNGQGFAIKDAVIGATIFRKVYGTVKDIQVQNCTSEISLFNTIESTGTLEGLIVDANTSYTCKWDANNMSLVASANNGLIKDCEVAATITLEDPNRTAFNFGVFCPKLTNGRFVNCVNRSDVTCSNSHYSRGCGLGGIVGIISSTQTNSVNILEECKNYGNITLTVNPGTGYSRISCVGGIAGGNYTGGYDAAPWKEASMPSKGIVYKCKNEGNITLNWTAAYANAGSDTAGSQGASIGGIIGATINDVVECSNVGKIVANFNVGAETTTACPKIGGVVGCAHNRVIDCSNGNSLDSSKGSIEVNGRVRNISSALYCGTGPINFPCIGGVAGAVGCDTAANSTSAGSEISGCKNYSASITNNATVTAGGTKYVASVCGWTVSTNSNNTDPGNTGLPVLNPQ